MTDRRKGGRGKRRSEKGRDWEELECVLSDDIHEEDSD